MEDIRSIRMWAARTPASMDVKRWKPVGNPHKYDGQRIVIGSVTDGYNPYEAEFGNTRRLLEELRGTQAEIMICTKSDLVLRDGHHRAC